MIHGVRVIFKSQTHFAKHEILTESDWAIYDLINHMSERCIHIYWYPLIYWSEIKKNRFGCTTNIYGRLNVACVHFKSVWALWSIQFVALSLWFLHLYLHPFLHLLDKWRPECVDLVVRDITCPHISTETFTILSLQDCFGCLFFNSGCKCQYVAQQQVKEPDE